MKKGGFFLLKVNDLESHKGEKPDLIKDGNTVVNTMSLIIGDMQMKVTAVFIFNICKVISEKGFKDNYIFLIVY